MKSLRGAASAHATHQVGCAVGSESGRGKCLDWRRRRHVVRAKHNHPGTFVHFLVCLFAVHHLASLLVEVAVAVVVAAATIVL
ncbi:hypothetical protein N9L68_03500 [bacterium]|nr:hypothetical protein [bacterium]